MIKKIVFWVFFAFTIGITQVKSQYQIRIENERLVNSTTYDFDVYFYATSGSFELATASIAVLYNTSWPAGTMTGSYVSGSSELSNTAQIPNAPVNLTATPGTIRLTGRSPVGTGNGSIISSSGVRYVTIRLTCSSGFVSGEIPNFRFRFTTTPFQTLNVYISNVNTEVIGGASFLGRTGQANSFNPIYWNGSNWVGYVYDGVGTTSGSGASVTTPTSDLDATLFSNFTATSNLNVRSLNVFSGNTFTMGNYTLSVGYKLNNFGTLNLEGSSLNLTGSTTATQNQTLNVGNLNLSNLGFSGSGTKTLSNTVTVSNEVTGAGTATLNANGNLVLKSTTTATARVAELPSGASISGNFSFERFMPANRRFRLLACPVSGATANHWRNFGDNTPGKGTHITGAGGATNGFDPSTSNNPSAFTYDESSGNPSITPDPGWTGFSAGSQVLNPGEGYRVLVRGDRTINPLINDPSRNATTLTVTGTYPGKSITKNLSYTGTNGWNLVGNPFPSPISWAAITKSGSISSTYYAYNTSSNSYVSWNGTTGSASDVIHSGQGFFVRANATGASLTFDEADKVTGNGGFFGKKSLVNHLAISLIYDSTNYDKAFLHFRSEAKNGLDDFDAIKMQNPNVNIALIDIENNRLNIASMSSLESNEVVVPISFANTVPENYKLKFEGVNSFSPYEIYFEDKKQGSIQLVKEGDLFQLSFADELDLKDGRFYLKFKKQINGLDADYLNNYCKLYPNPSEGGVVKVSFGGPILSLEKSVIVYDASGKMVLQVECLPDKAQVDLPIKDLASGVYTITFKTVAGIIVKRLVINH